MTFRIADVVVDRFPDEHTVRTALEGLALPEEFLLGRLRRFSSNTESDSTSGYQKILAAELADFLRRQLTTGQLAQAANLKYSSHLNERADLVLAPSTSERRIFFEIEFRPNVEKDLVKFQIGHNARLLGVAVLILAADRDSINPRYTTMPVFSKFVRVIRELGPSYPLLLCGISGTGNAPLTRPPRIALPDAPAELPSELKREARVITNYGRLLNEQWGVGARHALYHKNGTFYMPLERFPGAYFDPNGYVVFKNQGEFLNCPRITTGDRVHVPGGIASMPGYIRKR